MKVFLELAASDLEHFPDDLVLAAAFVVEALFFAQTSFTQSGPDWVDGSGRSRRIHGRHVTPG